MSKPKVIVSRRWPEEVEKHMTIVFDVTLNEDDHIMSADEMKNALKTADAFCPTVTDAVNADVLGVEGATAKIIGSNGVGFNHIDLDAAKAAGFTVTNTPEVLTDCTADIAMNLLLTVARRTGEGERHVRAGEWVGWRPTHMMGTKVTGKTIGLIGFGRIARAMAQRAHHGFGMKVLFHDPYPPSAEDAAALGAEACDSIDDVLARSDFVSIHCPGGAETYHLMNADRIGKMKPGAFLINSARGDVIDPAALIDALKSGTIAGAGLDVFEGEPKVPEELIKMENVVLLPHLGSASLETRVAMGMRVVDNLTAFFAGEDPQDKLV
ncbi:MAG: D-glycerate dehydrogenase [Rhodospirillales bacterium]|nr:D-glycerate dehydrogenase [Rhodospirillales bacterium]